jgi:hypothetical protein
MAFFLGASHQTVNIIKGGCAVLRETACESPSGVCQNPPGTLEGKWCESSQGCPCTMSLDVQSIRLWNCASDSAPSEARKRGSGGGSPRKYDDLLIVMMALPLPGVLRFMDRFIR